MNKQHNASQEHAWFAWRSGGATALSKWLGKEFGRGPANRSSAIESVFRLASRLRKGDPGAALAILDVLLSYSSDHVASLLLAANLHFRSGNTDKMQGLAKQLLSMPTVEPEHRLVALGLLSKKQLDEPTLDLAKKAFDQAGRQLGLIDSMLDIALRAADWDTVDQLTALIRQSIAEDHPLGLRRTARTHLLWCDDEAENIQVIQAAVRDLLAVNRVAPQQHYTPAPAPASLAGRRMRIGYLSSDFRDHPTARLMLGLWRHHDRRHFDIFLYCSGWDDESKMREALVKGVEHFVSVAELSDQQAAERIRADAIDILVELNGPTHGTRMGIMAHRPAPVQIEYLGWPGSIGGQLADYVVADGYTVPSEREHLYPEKLIRLHQVYQVNDYAAAARVKPPPKALFKLPEGCPVIGSFNNINKVRNEVWTVWMAIMRAVPDAVLWMLEYGELAQKNICAAAAREGVAPERIIFAPSCAQGQHLSRLQHCDLMLDPWPYGGHTTTSDALFAGVPVIALEGRSFASRVSGALLSAAGLGALVQPDTAQYIARAVQILTEPSLGASLRRFLHECVPSSNVFNARDKARQIEAAFRHAHQLALANKPPEAMNLQPRQNKPQPEFRWPDHAYFGKPISAQQQGDGLFHMSDWELPTESQELSAITGPPAVPPAAMAVANLTLTHASKANASPVRPTLMLVAGPWSSGSSAVAGLLAMAGLKAPGPYVKINDPQTSQTYEMQAFRRVLNLLASEKTLRRTVPPEHALQALQHFRDTELMPHMQNDQGDAPIMLKHGLAMLFLDELATLFDLRVVGVLRPLKAIESTRLRRGWHESFGQRGAQVLYQALFTHLVNSSTAFHLVRYPALLAAPESLMNELMAFCGWEPDDAQRKAALGFLRKE